MSLKTLHLTNAWHATSGGIGTFYRSLLDAANATGHQLRLVVPAEADSIQEVGAYGRIYQVKSARAPLNGSYRFLYPLHYLRPHGRICEILNAEQPDLIEICDKYTLPYLGGLLRIGKLKGVELKAPIVGLSCERMDENLAAYFGAHAVRKLVLPVVHEKHLLPAVRLSCRQFRSHGPRSFAWHRKGIKFGGAFG